MGDIGKLPLVKLELFVLLVYYGIKDAYLVDCCCMDEKQAQAFLKYFQHKFALKNDAVLTVLLESDILFVNRESLRNKMVDLEQKNNLPLVVDIGITLAILTETNIQFQLVSSTFKAILGTQNNTESLAVPATDEICAVVGLPFIAGWLLGYPCLYRAQSSREAETLSEDSTMINLLKLSIIATVEVHVPAGSEKVKKGQQKLKTATQRSGSTSQTVEVMGFSIPETLWESSSEARARLNARFDEILTTIQNKANYVNGSVGPVKVTSVKAEQEVHTVPKIAL